MNICIFWAITPCSPLKVSRRFGGTEHVAFIFRVDEYATQEAKVKQLASRK
jgi:hypothetical protein